MRRVRLLVVEGNTADVRRSVRDATGLTPGEAYAAVLRNLAPGSAIDLCSPADAAATLPAPLDGYDGLAVTGSALNIWKAEPESLRQIELIRTAFETGVPMFGSCWGLQLGVVAAGGEVRPNPRGREVGVARGITLSQAGRGHPLHAGRSGSFDAPAIHGDEVVRLPEGATVTASNAVSAVQAAEIRCGRGVFWGVQFHPEYDFGDVAAVLRSYGSTLVDEGTFANRADLDRYITDLTALGEDADQTEVASRLGFGTDLVDVTNRRREIINWLTHQVGVPQA